MKGLFSRVGPKEFLREFWALGMVKSSFRWFHDELAYVGPFDTSSNAHWAESGTTIFTGTCLTRHQSLSGASQGPLFLVACRIWRFGFFYSAAEGERAARATTKVSLYFTVRTATPDSEITFETYCSLFSTLIPYFSSLLFINNIYLSFCLAVK